MKEQNSRKFSKNPNLGEVYTSSIPVTRQMIEDSSYGMLVTNVHRTATSTLLCIDERNKKNRNVWLVDNNANGNGFFRLKFGQLDTTNLYPGMVFEMNNGTAVGSTANLVPDNEAVISTRPQLQIAVYNDSVIITNDMKHVGTQQLTTSIPELEQILRQAKLLQKKQNRQLLDQAEKNLKFHAKNLADLDKNK